MKKILKRLGAYVIDMMVVLVIVQCLSGISLINPQLDNYNKYYEEYSKSLTEYTETKLALRNSYKDNKITEKEYNKIIKNHDNYKNLIDKYYSDKKITKNEYNKINKSIDKYYMNNYKKQYYNVESNSICYFIVYLIVVAAYFIFFNYYTDGQTLGKKVFRLKIVNNNDEKEKVSLLNYLIRAIFLYQPVYYIIKLIGIYTLNKSNYYNVTSIVYDIQYYLEFIIILTIIIRIDGRGLHDLIAKTRVASYDKNGTEIDKYTISFITKKLDEKVIEQKDKINKSKKLKD